MRPLKSLILVTALLAGGTSLALAQIGSPTGARPPVAGGDAGSRAAPGSASGTSTRTAHHHGTKMYMLSANRTHKGSKLTPASNAKPQMKQ